ncbi:MAG: tRNA uridine-5-carboxymethylaminomethyl(34) synthesis enzyme MnmG, partial [Planctomycetes bacterium]|nr:tRNA uridine-5-carboxymethylaminomethyl(34) synthesis enzyme MnmG [Planctomycetota bacterium]
MSLDFDVVVIGGGHAGVESAWAAARLGARTALVSLRPERIAQMSCNPAIGGIGKGQMVREIDALGGLMGLAADATGIQFRMLNRSKGPAVWGPRCQSDRHAYAEWVQQALVGLPRLTVIAAEATGIIAEGGRVAAVRLAPPGPAGPAAAPASAGPAGPEYAAGAAGGEPESGATFAGGRGRYVRPAGPEELRCRCAVVAAGTFLNGLMHTGPQTWPGGRFGEPAAERLGESLRRLGLETGRLKTGTCPRIAAESIDYSRCRRQDGDAEPVPFSFLNRRLDVRQVPCWITATTDEIHRAVRANFHRAPLYT